MHSASAGDSIRDVAVEAHLRDAPSTGAQVRFATATSSSMPTDAARPPELTLTAAPGRAATVEVDSANDDDAIAARTRPVEGC